MTKPISPSDPIIGPTEGNCWDAIPWIKQQIQLHSSSL